MGVCDHSVVGNLLEHTEFGLITLNFKWFKQRAKTVNLLSLLKHLDVILLLCYNFEHLSAEIICGLSWEDMSEQGEFKCI